MMIVAAPSLATAQQSAPASAPPKTSSVGGVVSDSIHGGPLVGAVVTVTGSTRQATTGGGGDFRIDSIPPGQHSIVVTHPLLDTLGLAVHSAPFTIAAGQSLLVALSTPSLADVREATCPVGSTTHGPSMLVGRVNKADTDEPAGGAVVSLVFRDPFTAKGPERVRTTHADPSGQFSICGLPPKLSGTLQASLGGVATADLPVQLNEEPMATALLSIGAAGAGSAVLTGVVTTSLGAGVGGAQVSVAGTAATATTADDGSFTLKGLPSGTREAVVRKIGYAQASIVVSLSARQPASVKVSMGEAQALKTVRVVGMLEDGLAKIGFSSRKQIGMGWYVTPEEIAKRSPLLTSDILRMTSGLRVVNASNGTYLQGMQGPSSTSEGCLNIFMDHVRFVQEKPGDVDNAMPVEDLGAVEYYAGTSTTPVEFNVPGSVCSTLVIWSKTRLTTFKP